MTSRSSSKEPLHPWFNRSSKKSLEVCRSLCLPRPSPRSKGAAWRQWSWICLQNNSKNVSENVETSPINVQNHDAPSHISGIWALPRTCTKDLLSLAFPNHGSMSWQWGLKLFAWIDMLLGSDWAYMNMFANPSHGFVNAISCCIHPIWEQRHQDQFHWPGSLKGESPPRRPSNRKLRVSHALLYPPLEPTLLFSKIFYHPPSPYPPVVPSAAHIPFPSCQAPYPQPLPMPIRHSLCPLICSSIKEVVSIQLYPPT